MHTQLMTETCCGVHAMRDAEGRRVWIGEVTHPEGETPEELGSRWNAFSRLMFAYGVEPSSDEPEHTVIVKGEPLDRYLLQEIVEDEEL